MMKKWTFIDKNVKDVKETYTNVDICTIFIVYDTARCRNQRKKGQKLTKYNQKKFQKKFISEIKDLQDR